MRVILRCVGSEYEDTRVTRVAAAWPPRRRFFLSDSIMDKNGVLTTVLVLLMLSSAFVTYSIPTTVTYDTNWDSREERAAARAEFETTFARRRIYFAVTTLLMMGAAIASWQGNGTWTASLGGASVASVLVYALGLHQLM